MGGWEYLKEVVKAERDNSAVENGQSMGLIDKWGCKFFFGGVAQREGFGDRGRNSRRRGFSNSNLLELVPYQHNARVQSTWTGLKARRVHRW